MIAMKMLSSYISGSLTMHAFGLGIGPMMAFNCPSVIES